MPKEAQTADVMNTILKMKDAFTAFESQSGLLQDSYENLEKNLAESNRRLSENNRALSVKIEELKRMSSRLQCIIESLTDGVLVVDNELVVERCNSTAERLLNLPRAGILRRPYAEIMNGLGNTAMLRSALEQNSPVYDDQRCFIRETGEETIVLASVAPIRLEDGSVLGAVEVMRDVTEIRRLEEETNSQKRMAVLGEMAASVAHEFRNPLGAIDGFARLLKRDLEDQPNYHRLASNIVEGVTNLNYIVTNLLAYARPMALEYETFNVRELLNEAHRNLSYTASRAGIELVIGESADDLSLTADVRQLRQVIMNLGRNAVEACDVPPRGDCAQRRVVFDCVVRGNHAGFTVSDNGIGITEADQQRLFNPFFTRKANGTGLGLSLCHKIVTAHGGRITVTSKPDAGSTFEVALPYKKNRKGTERLRREMAA